MILNIWLKDLRFISSGFVFQYRGGSQMKLRRLIFFSRHFMPISFILFYVFFPSALSSQANLPNIIKKVKPSVVTVLTYDDAGNLIGEGSGFFINKEADIITNRHVLEGSNSAEVKTLEGKKYSIDLILAENKEADLLLISISNNSQIVNPLHLCNTLPTEGERILVIGNPLGLEQTISDGIVSAIRYMEGYGNIIQITAPISPGSSGSPVVNMNGEVIGVATMAMVGGQNLNFAVSSEKVKLLDNKESRLFKEWRDANIAENRDASMDSLGKALDYWKNNNYEQAIFFTKDAIEKDPTFSRSLYFLGQLYYELERYEDAIEAYTQAIRLEPSYADLYCDLGNVYYILNRYTEAIDIINQAIRLDPNSASAYRRLGLAYHYSGRRTDAISAFNQAIRLKPDYAEAYYGLSLSYFELERYTESINASRQAIRLNPAYLQAHIILGDVQGRLNRFSEAAMSFKQAIRIKPDEAYAHYRLGMTYVMLTLTEAALNEYKILRNLDSDLAIKLFNFIYKY